MKLLKNGKITIPWPLWGIIVLSVLMIVFSAVHIICWSDKIIEKSFSYVMLIAGVFLITYIVNVLAKYLQSITSWQQKREQDERYDALLEGSKKTYLDKKRQLIKSLNNILEYIKMVTTTKEKDGEIVREEIPKEVMREVKDVISQLKDDIKSMQPNDHDKK